MVVGPPDPPVVPAPKPTRGSAGAAALARGAEPPSSGQTSAVASMRITARGTRTKTVAFRNITAILLENLGQTGHDALIASSDASSAKNEAWWDLPGGARIGFMRLALPPCRTDRILPVLVTY